MGRYPDSGATSCPAWACGQKAPAGGSPQTVVKSSLWVLATNGVVPDVAVSGTNGSTGLVDGLLGLMLRNQSNGNQPFQEAPTKA